MLTAEDVQFTRDIDPLAVAAYFIRADQERDEPDVTPMKLEKLIYFAQAHYLAATRHRMFDADVEAWEHGPAVTAVWKEFTGRQIICPEAHDPVMLRDVPPDVEDFLDRVWDKYGDLSATQLRKLTHRQAPWKDHFVDGHRHTVIPDEDMASYFTHQVHPEDQILHRHVVVADPSVYEDDAEADARLDAFLAA